MSEWTETYRGAVLANEYDAETHMNSALYVSRFDQATWFLLGSTGMTPKSVRATKRRIAVVRQSYQYLRELRGGDMLTIRSGFTAVGKKHFRFLHQMWDAETARMVATSDCVAVQASLEKGKTEALPAKLRKQIETLLITSNVEDEDIPKKV